MSTFNEENKWLKYLKEPDTEISGKEKHIFHRALVLVKFEGSYVSSQTKSIDTIARFCHGLSYPRLHAVVGHRKFQELLLRWVSAYHVDLIVVDLPFPCYQIDDDTFDKLRHAGVMILGTAFDTSTDLAFYLQRYALVDGVICSSPLLRSSFDAVGIPSVLYWPRPRSLDWFEDHSETNRDIDVAFVGALKFGRDKWIAELRSRGVEVYTAGYGSQRGGVSVEEYKQIFRRSKIVLSFNEQNHISIFLSNDPASQWRTTPTLRNVEIALSGAMCLAQWVPELETMFPDNTVDWFNNADELVKKIKFYLENDKKRIARAKMAQEHAIERYSDPNAFAKRIKILSSKSARNFASRGMSLRRNVVPSDGYLFGRMVFYLKSSLKALSKRKVRDFFSLTAFFVADAMRLNFGIVRIAVFVISRKYLAKGT